MYRTPSMKEIIEKCLPSGDNRTFEFLGNAANHSAGISLGLVCANVFCEKNKTDPIIIRTKYRTSTLPD